MVIFNSYVKLPEGIFYLNPSKCFHDSPIIHEIWGLVPLAKPRAMWQIVTCKRILFFLEDMPFEWRRNRMVSMRRSRPGIYIQKAIEAMAQSK